MISTECPCGRARAGCEYHDPALQPVDKAAIRAAAKPIHFGGYPGCIFPGTGEYTGKVVAVHPDGSFEIVLDGEVRAVCVRGMVTL
jgi:hypothetical protein